MEADSIVLYVFMFGGILSIMGARVMRQKRRHSAKQLSEFRSWRSGDAEAEIKSKIGKLQEKLKAMERRREEERAMSIAEEIRDIRGRQIYGDAWDDPEAGEGAPIRDLLALSDAEVELLQRQAKALFEHQKKIGAVEAVRATRSSSRVAPELFVGNDQEEQAALPPLLVNKARSEQEERRRRKWTSARIVPVGDHHQSTSPE